jgi:hypothetical protein
MLLFLWLASRGYRSRPWASPYLRWRVETYSGIPAESLDRATFAGFVWRERRSLYAYLKWVSKNNRLLRDAD